jgi:hypothetical protein
MDTLFLFGLAAGMLALAVALARVASKMIGAS